MAKKHKKKTPHRRPRRRSKMSGIDMKGIDFEGIALTVAGAAAASFANKIIPESAQKYSSWIKVAAGVVAPMMVKDPKTKKMVQSIGTGMAVSGAIDLLKQQGILSGADDENGNDLYIRMNGTEDILAGNILNGNQDILAGQSILNGQGSDDYMIYDNE